MSWTELMPGGPGTPPADPLRVRILGGLAYSALDLRERIARAAAGECADCRPGRPCPDHAAAATEAAGYEDAFQQVESGTREWCDLAVKLISEMN